VTWGPITQRVIISILRARQTETSRHLAVENEEQFAGSARHCAAVTIPQAGHFSMLRAIPSAEGSPATGCGTTATQVTLPELASVGPFKTVGGCHN
jgi:hypothetical protein